MKAQNYKAKEITDYIESFPENVREQLHQLRSAILESAPEAEESISYKMPAYKISGRPLVYFAAFKNHIGIYATPTGNKEFEKLLSPYKQGKGSVQFPIDKPLPIDLIKKIVAFRVKENLERKLANETLKG